MIFIRSDRCLRSLYAFDKEEKTIRFDNDSCSEN